ncbi:hypothetical protein J4E89_009213 [Alternaria sp. Ai002NY15]|nr:hypothetical protein J4E89_009213 [Alternaria sp. Ai002NY15]
MATATQCEVEKRAPAPQQSPTAGDNAPPPPSRKKKRWEWYRKHRLRNKPEVHCCSYQKRILYSEEEPLPIRIQIPLVVSGKTKGKGGRRRKGREDTVIRSDARGGGDEDQAPLVTLSIRKDNASVSPCSIPTQIIDISTHAGVSLIIEIGPQIPIQHMESNVNPAHVVDDIPVRVERPSIHITTDSTCSQSIRYPSPIDTPATELSDWLPPSPSVLASVGGQFEKGALSHLPPAHGRTRVTGPVGGDGHSNSKCCPVIKITNVDDVDGGELVEKAVGGCSCDISIGEEIFTQLDCDEPLRDMPEASLGWVSSEVLDISISLGILRACTYPCVGNSHFEEDLVSAHTV